MEEIDNDFYISTYVINMKNRPDRRNHILEQFQDKPEFKLNFIDAETHSIGAVGLWKSMVKVVNTAIDNDEDIIIVCEDDHTFTAAYSKEYLFASILEASRHGIELLSGGIGGFGVAIPVSSNLYWMDWYWCNQFLVIFRPFYERILGHCFQETYKVDWTFSALKRKKMTMYPFISIQLDFGYSDVTPSNDRIRGKISSYFANADKRLSLIHGVNLYYNHKDKWQNKI